MNKRMQGFALLAARLAALLVPLLWVTTAQAQQQTAAQVNQPDGWNADLLLPEPQDLNADPSILEFNLEAVVKEMEILPGKKTQVWTYNGYLPGPLIRLKVGDRLIVHFKNSLPAPTSIHWHGLRITNAMDGVPGFTQAMIDPGEEFTYDYVVPDAGTFWYHPHVDSAAQVGYGLYGPMVVDDPQAKAVPGDELILLLSDMSLTEDGQLQDPKVGGRFGDLFGREGNVLLVNGKVMPTLKMRQGKQQRWRVINAARTRYYTLRYRRSPLVILGGQAGMASRTRTVNELKVVPGERFDFVFTPPDDPGTEGVLKWYPTDRGYGSTYNRLAEDLVRMVTVDEPAVTPEAVPELLRSDIAPLDITGAKEQTLNLTIGYDQNDDVSMGINGVHHEHAVPIIAKVGETQVWTVRNDTDFSHPFHMHGFFFQVLDPVEGVLEWKDTVDVPQHTELKLAVQFDNRPGMWMYHCHILDHAEVGMMGHLHVEP